MVLIINSLELEELFYFIADAYYASHSIINGVVAQGSHLISRVRSNAVAYFPCGTDSRKERMWTTQKIWRKSKIKNIIE